MTNPPIELADLLTLPGSDWLNIGGTARRDQWKVLNILPGPDVDYVGDVRDLSRFPARSFDVVYASHILEHLNYQTDLDRALHEIYRILRQGGKFFISVPNLDTLCRLFVHERAGPDDRLNIMRMMYGGQTDEFDYHHVGLYPDLLATYLGDAGFHHIARVPEFNLFDDDSSLRYAGVLVSLNLVAFP